METIYIFPKWKPSNKVINSFNGYNRLDYVEKESAFKAFRNSSSLFISTPEVRIYLFKKYNKTCVYCGAFEKLEIDHIKSVSYCFNNKLFDLANSEENLQVLCKSCNASKTP